MEASEKAGRASKASKALQDPDEKCIKMANRTATGYLLWEKTLSARRDGPCFFRRIEIIGQGLA